MSQGVTKGLLAVLLVLASMGTGRAYQVDSNEAFCFTDNLGYEWHVQAHNSVPSGLAMFWGYVQEAAHPDAPVQYVTGAGILCQEDTPMPYLAQFELSAACNRDGCEFIGLHVTGFSNAAHPVYSGTFRVGGQVIPNYTLTQVACGGGVHVGPKDEGGE